MELRHLRYFIAVAEELNFHRAAERIHIDQSPLSRTIRELETHLGVALFARTQRSIRITPAGTRMLEEARAILMRIDQALRAVREMDGRCRAPLRVGIADRLAQPALAFRLAQWREQVPHTGLQITEMRAAELAMALRREELDVGFSFGVPEADGIVQQVAWTDSLMVLLPAGHALATQGRLTLPQVVEHPLVAYDPDCIPGAHRQIDMLIRRSTSTPKIVDHASGLAGLITKIGAGCGIGLVDTGHMQMLSRPDIVAVPLVDDTAVLSTYILHKRLKTALSEVLERFIAHMTALS